MVDFTAMYDEYDFDDETHDQRPASARKRTSANRELTGQQRCSTRARYSRPKSGFSGAHRRRGKRSLA